LTLEGQTGGFLTPTAYVVYAEKGQFFSHPAIGFHFIDASAVIGNVETFSITEGFASRAEAGYTRSQHQFGDQPTTTATPLGLSNLWNYSGMNVFHGKVVVFKDGQFGAWMPGIAIGGVIRTNDHFVSGAANKTLTGTRQVVHQRRRVRCRDQDLGETSCAVPAEPGLEGDQCHDLRPRRPEHSLWRAVLRRFGHSAALGHGIVAVPSAGFTQEPKTSVNLNTLLNAALYQCEALLACNPASYPLMSAHIPTTLDYAMRVTQRDKPHFAFDIGVGQVAGTSDPSMFANPYFNPANPAFGPPVVTTPVNLQARHVVGMGLSYRYIREKG
jgi:hypothetical protein